jgi:hypothetical protein
MQIAAVLAILEVMDKEPGISRVWVTFTLLGAVAFIAVFWRRWAWICLVLLLGLLALERISELHDPLVGADLLREAGRGYFIHSYAAISIGLLLAAAGWRLQKKLSNRSNRSMADHEPSNLD